MPTAEKNIHNYWQVTIELPSGNGNGRELGIERWEMGIGFKFQMGMGMKPLKWEGIGTKICSRTSLYHTSEIHQIFCVCCLLLQHCNTLCTSGFVDNVMFSYNGPSGGVPIRQQARCSVYMA